MVIERLLQQQDKTKYWLSNASGVPHATLSDICNGKTHIEKCSADTVYKIAKALGVSMELLVEEGVHLAKREASYEYGLPSYLQSDLDAYKMGLKNGSELIDCLWSELYSSINIAEINDGEITSEHADYLRNKYLWGKGWER